MEDEEKSTPETAVAVAAEPEVAIDVAVGEDQSEVFVMARNAMEMQSAQAKLVAWARAKSYRVLGELKNASENLETARANKWRTAPFEALVNRISKRLNFYEKVTLALEAGYVIVPEMDLELIAIRTKKKYPRRNETGFGQPKDQESESPPPGEGRYVQPEADVNYTRRTIGEGENAVQRTYRWADEFREEVDFPFRLAKPEVLSATAQAMALKVFDEIGVLPKRVTGDPMIVGRVFLKEGYTRRALSFVIAWFINTRAL